LRELPLLQSGGSYVDSSVTKHLLRFFPIDRTPIMPATAAVSIVSTASAVSTVVPYLCWRNIAADPE
jgi:hypothetical protein